ncbi:MAG TPA: hypothetical protein DHW02_07910 [Ktedonobacter sp.]|nr:hypothetical protein [Ktedonobacter sp.]
MVELHWKGKNNPLTHPTHPSVPPLEIQAWYLPDPNQHATMQHPSPATSLWHNHLISGDRYDVLLHLLHEFAHSVDLIYIDPPFMTGRVFSQGKQVVYSDQWKTHDEYIQWLYETFVLLYALLTDTGSLYVHLDWRAAPYAKLLLDEVFLNEQGNNQEQKEPKKGQHNAGFQNEIIWHYQSGGRASRHFARKHDTILWYTKSAHYCFHPERIGERRGTQQRNHMRKEVTTDGKTTWTIRSAGHLYTYDEESLLTPSDVWTDLHHLHQKDPERTGYATQKPASLLERIIQVSSEENDLILDCFCGSGVTPIVAERLKRRWIACDKSEFAIQTTLTRLLTLERTYPFALMKTVVNEESEPH